MILSGEKQDISSEPDQGYWGKGGRDRNSDPMKPLRVYNNRVKRDLLLTTTKRVETDDIRLLDISCGRGGDIFKYNDIKMEFVTVINDFTHLVNRMYSFM